MLDRIGKSLLLTIALASATAGIVWAQLSPDRANSFGGAAAPAAPGAGSSAGAGSVNVGSAGSAQGAAAMPAVSAICRQSCEGAAATIAFQTSQGSREFCPTKAQVVMPCAPYACNAGAKTCRSSCSAGSDCAAGFTCTGGACVPRCTSCDDGGAMQEHLRGSAGDQEQEMRRRLENSAHHAPEEGSASEERTRP